MIPIDISDFRKIIKFISKYCRGGSVFVIKSLLALGISMFTYCILMDNFSPDRNIFTRVFQPDEHNFYSGMPGGYYSYLGDKVSKYALENSNLRVKNMEGTSTKNIRMVIKDERSFGIAQEDDLARFEVKDELKIVAPLYDERVHVLYSKKKLEEVREQLSAEEKKKIPRITMDSNRVTQKLFENSVVRTRSLMGSNISLPEAILAVTGLKPKELVFEGIGRSIKQLEGIKTDSQGGGDRSPDEKNKPIHIVLFVAGSNAPAFRKALADDANIQDSIGMMSVDHSVITALNTVRQGNYRYSNFRNLELGNKEYEETETIATRAVLISSNGIPSSRIGVVANALSSNELSSSDSDISDVQYKPLTEYPFLSIVATLAPSMLWENIVTWSLSILYFLVTIPIAFVLMSYVWSTQEERHYSNKIMKVYSSNILTSMRIFRRRDGQFKSLTASQNDLIIDSLCKAISKLIPLARRVRNRYRLGAITLSHQRQLLDNIY